MILKYRSILLAASLLAAPAVSAMAQQNNPAGNQGSNRSATASPGTADNPAVSGSYTADTAGGRPPTGNYSGSGTGSTATGATGRTVVPGNNSSVASSSGATRQEQTGGAGSGDK